MPSNNLTSGRGPLRVAMLGCGVVGTQVARLIIEQAADLAQRVGAPVELVGIAVRRLTLARDGHLPAELFTDDAEGLVTRGDIDVVIEVIGGIEPARTLILTALEHGASEDEAIAALLH
ncbi:MAG TPA: homoserine dehydrogenase, partial [Marmoricola sp.]|nr:homoserine dehydrogenase [Marmoricola sp.]